MKKLSITLLLLVVSFSLQAQVIRIDTMKSQPMILKTKNYGNTYNSYLYSLGIRVFQREQFPKLLNQQDRGSYNDLYLQSLIFKFNDNQINYRISASYYNDDETINNNCSDCDIANGKLSDLIIKLGFEKMISYTAIQPYFGFDLGYRNNRFKAKGNNAIESFTYTAPYDIMQEKNGAIFSPLIGINVNLINHISISAESSIDILYNYEHQDKTYQDASRTRTAYHDRNWEFLIMPVAVTLQYNFGEVN